MLPVGFKLHLSKLSSDSFLTISSIGRWQETFSLDPGSNFNTNLDRLFVAALVSGRKRKAATNKFNLNPAIKRTPPRHPYSSKNLLTSGGISSPPIPTLHTAIPTVGKRAEDRYDVNQVNCWEWRNVFMSLSLVLPVAKARFFSK